MKLLLILVNCLVFLNQVQGHNGSPKNNFLSLVSSNWNFRSYTSVGLNPPKCTVLSSHYSRSPYVSMYGLARNYSALLTGYNLDDRKGELRSNKGILYGLNAKVRPSMSGKARFLFHSDFAVPKIAEGNGDEFCCHIYYPPIKVTPSIRNALGTRYDDPRRDFGSDERLDSVIKSENPNSRKVTSCCFIIT